MTDMEILQIADQCGVVAVTKHEWDGKQFNHTDDYLDGDAAALVIFAKLVAQHEREACAKECDACICTAQASEAIRARDKHDSD